ncbi:hypothetical protein [Nostoc sp.]|uniref:hypothetical protein n=1 Tax=Nostoc sp. TaxID=1180 RepID=UPI002FFC2C35
MSTDKPFSTLSCAIARHRGLVGIASRREEATLTARIALAQPKVNKTATSSPLCVYALQIPRAIAFTDSQTTGKTMLA